MALIGKDQLAEIKKHEKSFEENVKKTDQK